MKFWEKAHPGRTVANCPTRASPRMDPHRARGVMKGREKMFLIIQVSAVSAGNAMARESEVAHVTVVVQTYTSMIKCFAIGTVSAWTTLPAN